MRSTMVRLLMVVIGLGLAACRPEPEEDWSRHPVVVLGVDGATWKIIDPMMARGELPNFRRLVDRGARADLIVLPPLTSPVVWTTFATGTFGRQHNILDFTYPYSVGPKHPVETSYRQEPAIWTVASEHRRKVGIVGYYVTHPAEIVDGFMISDTILQSRQGSTYPVELAEQLDLVSTPQERQQSYRRFLSWDYEPRAADDPEAPFHAVSRIARGRLDSAIIRDENVRRNVLASIDRSTDLFMTYLRIIDHACHSTWRFFDDSAFDEETDPEAKALLGGVIPEAYRFADEFLGEVLQAVGEDVNIVLISDHGSGSATGVYTIKDPRLADVLSGNHRHDGILLAAGPDVQPGVYEGVTMMDVMPLLLALLDLPISEELPGAVPEGMLASRFAERYPTSRVPVYQKEWAVVDDANVEPGVDEQAMDQLKALGYVSSSTQTGRDAVAETSDFWTAKLQIRRTSLLGELLFYLLREKVAEADQLMAVVAERDPELAKVLPRLVRGQAKTMQKDFDFPLFPEQTMESFLASHGLHKRPVRASGHDARR